MRINRFGAACLVIGGLLMAGAPAQSWAQGTKGKLSVGADVGTRLFILEPSSLEMGRFEMYRDLPGSTVVPERVVLKYIGADGIHEYTLTGSKLFERDQLLSLQARKPGNYNFQLLWNRVPHTYSTTARSPGSGEFFNTLPAPRPDSMAWRNSPYIGAIRQQWDPVRASLAWSPSQKLDSKAEVVHIGKSGGLPLSLSYNASSGPQREFIAPVDQTVQDFRFTQAFASGERSQTAFIRSFNIQGTFDYSMFRNAAKSVMVDNPQQSFPTSAAGTNSSLVSLPPDNQATSGTFLAAVSLPARTRVTGTVTRSWMTQNDPFFPQASNDSLKTNANYGLLALPRSSLNGKVQTSMINLSANSHPAKQLTLSAKYRTYDRKDNTESFHLRAMAISDRSINLNDTLTSEINPFTKTNTDLSASYQLMRGLAVTGGYSMENWKRDEEARNVPETKEKGPVAKVDFNGLEWLSLHASFISTQRRGDSYKKAATEIDNFRRFDLADRDRKHLQVMATVSPLSNIDVSFDFGQYDDKFPNSQYGTQSDKLTSKGVDVSWSPLKRISLNAGYSRDDSKNVLNSRYRTGAVGTPTYDNPTYRWTNTNTDKNETEYVGVIATVIPNRLDLQANVANIDAHFWVYNFNPQTPTGGTATQNLAATVENWPEVSNNLKPINVSLRYIYSNDWAITAGFRSEQYDIVDFRTASPLFAPFNALLGSNLPASIGTVTGTNTGQYHFLSNAYEPYTANWFTLTISYHPSALPFRRLAMQR